MASGSALKPFLPQSTALKQTDTLIQALLHFGLIHPTPPLITQLGQDQLDLALAKLTVSDKDMIDPKLKKLIRSHVYEVHSSHHSALISVRSWTMSEHVYRQQPCPFPTMARGLFTRENVHPERAVGDGRHCIVARGYDKFFNINELPSTNVCPFHSLTSILHWICDISDVSPQWDALKDRTKPPYHLTLKTNGCIILIAALTPTDLLVTSKHATVSSDLIDQEQSATHSAVGDRWVDRHLERVGMSRTELAHELWLANATAVAELTDDDFEEHVIPTPVNEVGLNLHGINLNTAELLTYPPDVVAQCAKRWGMHPTPFTTVHDIESVMKQCKNIEDQGWDGRQGHVEGVVVRGTPRDGAAAIDCGRPAASAFWKVKFEEPYLTYREWRELTRKMLHEFANNKEALNKNCPSFANPLTLKDSEEISKLLKVNVKKIRKSETRLYLHWVIQELLERPDTFDLWKNNRGIVATRLAFLEWRKSKQADSLAEQLGTSKSTSASESVKKEQQNFDKNLLVPIGIPGCGKTTLAIALKNLINSAHTQSDDIQTKKTGPAFIENVKNLLLDDSGPNVVIADKNNHLKTHRETLVEMISKLKQGIQVKTPQRNKALRETKFVQRNVRLIAITWDIDTYPAVELHQLAAQRIVQRGDNHQSLRPELTAGGIEAHDTILWRFLKTFEVFDPDINPKDQAFHHIIELKFADSLEFNLKTICNQLESIIPNVLNEVELTDERLKKALQVARTYKPRIKKEMKVDLTLQMPRYFGIKLQANLTKVMEEMFQELRKRGKDDRTVQDGLSFFLELCKTNRITAVPHITLLHQNEVQESKDEEHGRLNELWNHYQDLVLTKNIKFRLELGPNLVWNRRVMVIQASIKHHNFQETETLLNINDKANNGLQPKEDQKRYHVTVGTVEESIRPIEGLHLLNHFFSSTEPAASKFSDDDHSFQFVHVQNVVIDGVLKGLT